MSQEDKPVSPNPDEVICPNCCHQFRAIPQNVQRLMLNAGFEPPFTQSVAAQEPVAWRVWGVNPYQRYIVDTAYSQEDADDLADRLGEFWGGTDKLYANAVPCARCEEAERTESIATAKLGDEIIKNGTLQAKITEQAAELSRESTARKWAVESLEQYKAECTRLQHEVDRLTGI